MVRLVGVLCIYILGTVALFAQSKLITGSVKSKDDSSILPGVSVMIKGTSVGTATDKNGFFSLVVSPEKDTLVFLSIGMKQQEIVVKAEKQVNVFMETQLFDVEEVVVTALGIKKSSRELGFSTQQVNSNDLNLTGNSNVMTALQGKLAGVDIRPSSGMPGASAQLLIRGARSINSDNTPLYIVDGQPINSMPDFYAEFGVTGSDIANRAIDINPSDIETIYVLKGQAAAALYGLKASNGVIVITTKNAKPTSNHRPRVNLSLSSTVDQVSRKPDYQQKYAQGANGEFISNSSLSWGPEISQLSTYNSHVPEEAMAYQKPGAYFVPQIVEGGGSLEDAWVMPQTYDNFGDYFKYGVTNNLHLSVSQTFQKGKYYLNFGQTSQSGIAPETGMDRWNFKGSLEVNPLKSFKVGAVANYVQNDIEKLTGAGDAALSGVYTAPISYNLKGLPNHSTDDPYKQVYFRGMGAFNNPYWISNNQSFTESTSRYYGNVYTDYFTKLGDKFSLDLRYQVGIDNYTTNLIDFYGYGSYGIDGLVYDKAIESKNVNSLFVAKFNWEILAQLCLNATLGNELNQQNKDLHDNYGEGFSNPEHHLFAQTLKQSVTEELWKKRTLGTFGSLSLGYKSFLFLSATGRNDVVSNMPRNNRSFFYPSLSASGIVSELDALKSLKWLNYAQLRASVAEVGQIGDGYLMDYYVVPQYGGGFYMGAPIIYPLTDASGGAQTIEAYTPNKLLYDPALEPQNTRSYELGCNLQFFNKRFEVDYTYSKQQVEKQVFSVPVAASNGINSKMMNAGDVEIDAHEIILNVVPIQTDKFSYTMGFNFSKVINTVNNLAPGVESIFLGGFVTPQVRASAGSTYPIIYGSRFLRDQEGNIVVVDDPGAANHGLPAVNPLPGNIGDGSPDFIVGHTSGLRYKNFRLDLVFEWKQGGDIFSGSNGLLDYYGLSDRTEDRTSTFVIEGVKPDGSPNDIVRGGVNDQGAYQELFSNILVNIDENSVYENSYVKLREVALNYQLPKQIFKTRQLGFTIYVRNLLLWSALPNFDPESSQGNNNMGGAFELLSLPQVSSLGFSIDCSF